MTSREIITRLIENKNPVRIGFDFADNSDFYHGRAVRLTYPHDPKLASWGFHAELLARTDFKGEVRLDHYGNIFGRFNERTAGECVKGVLQDGWECLDNYAFPDFDESFDAETQKLKLRENGLFNVAYLPIAIFSFLRDSRLMNNALMDTLAEPENVEHLLSMETELLKKCIDRAAALGYNAVGFADDMGTQTATFFSLNTFRTLFKNHYRQVIGKAHEHNMKFILHSCGYVYEFIDDLISVGVDA